MTNRISLIAPRGNTLSITAAGQGPPLVLLHGFPLDHRLWANQLDLLAPHFHVLAPDFRGFAGSTLGDANYSLQDLADDVDCIRTHLAGNQPMMLCGLSMGGYVAFEYWRRYRGNLSGLVLANTKPTADSPAAKAARLAMAQVAEEQGTWPAVAGMLPKLLSTACGSPQVQLNARVEAMMRAVRPQSIAAAQRAMAERHDFSASLEMIHTPTLVLTGADDSIAPPLETQAWASQIVNSKYACLPGAGHLTPIEQPQLFNQALIEFASATHTPKAPST